MTRLAALAERLEEPLLVTDLTNVRYLTGFDSSNAAVLVRPGGEATLFTDFRYVEEARRVEGVEVQMTRRSGLEAIVPLLGGRVGFESAAVSYADWQALADGALELVPRRGLVEALRAVKDAEEVAAIRRTARIADRAFEALTAETWVGRTERELAWRLRELLHAHGADELAFDTIVAAGENGSLPHATPSDRLVERGTLVTVDWGARVDGYCSDCTRTVSTGDLSPRLRELYDVCLAAQEAAVAGIRPGLTGAEADRLARAPIEAAGYGDNFGHGLGHGVGLAVHEAPRLSRDSDVLLEVGQIVTVEPGIYVEGTGGFRIEDLGVLREDGVEVFSSFPKHLIDVS